jgi:hypothetical protein
VQQHKQRLREQQLSTEDLRSLLRKAAGSGVLKAGIYHMPLGVLNLLKIVTTAAIGVSGGRVGVVIMLLPALVGTNQAACNHADAHLPASQQHASLHQFGAGCCCDAATGGWQVVGQRVPGSNDRMTPYMHRNQLTTVRKYCADGAG